MRLTRLLAVVMTAALLSAALATQVAEANQRWSGSQPSVGQCRKLTTSLIEDHASNTTSPISCKRAHNSRVIAVRQLPTGVTWGDLSTDTKLHNMAVSLCYPAFQAALGQNNAVRDRTAYTWFYFVPTKSQRAAHQRWFRCDLGLQHATRYAVLPTDHVPALRDATPSNNVARCLRLVNGHYLTTSCSTAHAYRSAGTFGVAKKSYPGETALLQQGRSRCPRIVATDTNFRWTWNSQPIWNRGHNHIVVCYKHSTK